MSKKSNRTKSARQPTLKLEGQKLFVIDDQGGNLSSFGGLPAVAKIAQNSGLLDMAVEFIPEWRQASSIDFESKHLLAQRLFLAALGYADAIDCTFWKEDPVLKSIVGKSRKGNFLASQSTHTRMEQSMTKETIEALESLPFRFFVEQRKHAPQELTVYLDGSAIRTFGAQQNSTYRGGKKYSQTQYFPLIATTDGGDLLLAQLREGGAADAHALTGIQNLVLDLKAQWPRTELTLVLDTGFNSPALLDFLESMEVEYECGYPATASVKSKIKDEIQAVEAEFRALHGEPKYIGPKVKADARWQTDHEKIRSLPHKERMQAEAAQASRKVRKIIEIMHNGTGWDCDRRLIVRIDYNDRGLDVRCVVTNKKLGWPQSIYEDDYCRRARIEMFIKEKKSHCKVPLSAQEFTSNQFRFCLQGMVYMALHLLRRKLPARKQNRSIATIRKNLLLIPALIETSERRTYVHLSSIHPGTQTMLALTRKLQKTG